MQELTTIGMDIAKQVFHVVGIDRSGRQCMRVKLKRSEVRSWFARQSAVLVGMEACGGAHYWARELRTLGHRPKLMAPGYVKAYLHGNKNDWADAAAIAEAAGRAGVPSVSIAEPAAQAVQALHRLRQRCMGERNRLINQLRALLMEFGVVLPKALKGARVSAAAWAAPESTLIAPMRVWVAELLRQWGEQDERVAWADQQIALASRDQALVRKLCTVRGIGGLGASALSVKLNAWRAYQHGRHFAASLGLVPRHSGTGDKVTLGAISKRGDVYLRTLLIQGARAVYMQAHRREDALSRWLLALAQRRGAHKAIVALANKNARIAFALASAEQDYDLARAFKA